jgi:DNA repair exonuclease SbcCD ATPase subunit
MANEQELNEKNEYFEYVESRIENLEKLILQKDDELKSLILKTSQREPVQLEKDRNEDQPEKKSEESFERVFQDIKEEEARFLKNKGDTPQYETAELNSQLHNIEKREKMVQEMLDSLGTALSILKKRHEEVNRKEETLNSEYRKLLEIEALYKKSEGLDSLNSAFGQLPGRRESADRKMKTSEIKDSKE